MDRVRGHLPNTSSRLIAMATNLALIVNEQQARTEKNRERVRAARRKSRI